MLLPGLAGCLLVQYLNHVSVQLGVLQTGSESWRLKGISFSLPACPCPKLLESSLLVPHHGPMESLKFSDSQEAGPGSVFCACSCVAWAMSVPEGR